MRIKIFPKNEQAFSKFFIVLTPLLLLLFGITALTKEAYFVFANILPQNNILNSGFLEKLNNHIIYSLILSFLIVFLTVYLLPKTLGRKLLIFPIFFLTSLGVIGLESLDLLLAIIFPENFLFFGNISFTLFFKILMLFAFVGLVILNILAKKEPSLFISSQYLFGASVFYLISLIIYRGDYVVFSDNFFINAMYISTHIYVGYSFVFLSLLHFMITKGINGTLYSKTLGSIGFWGFLFLLPWTNFKFYFGSVLPNWIENISLYLSISLSLPLLAITVNFFRTVASRNDENKIIYGLVSFSFGIFVVSNIFQIVSSLSNIIPILSLTNFEIAIRYGYVLSCILITVSFIYYLIPKIFGREIKFTRIESMTSFLLKLVVSGTLFSNALIGIISGYSWNAGANAGNPTIYGEGFSLLWSLISTPLTLILFLSLILLLPFFLFFLSVLKAVVNGPITEAETIELTEEELPV
mgnify:FL=1